MEAAAFAAARGVSFIFGRIFGQKLENLDFCVVFVNKMMFRALFYSCLLFLWWKCRKYHAFRLCFLLIFRISVEVFVWKALKTRAFCVADVSKVKQQETASTG